jgi:hypothetical protein
MTTISQPTFKLVTRTVPIDGGIFGLREIDSFGSILRVRRRRILWSPSRLLVKQFFAVPDKIDRIKS